MKRVAIWPILVLAVAAFAIPTVRADVKTSEKTLVKLEGILGGVTRLFGGSAAKEGVTSTVALKGSRKASMGETSGEIIDLAEEKLYRVDVKRREYRVVTFDQLRKEWKDAQKEAEKNAQRLRESQKEEAEKPAVQMEFTADVKETGQKKVIAGYNTREVILTMTGREKGKTLEQSGGFVLTNTMWLGPRIAALDEILQFDLKYLKAIAGDQFGAQMQQLATAFALFPSLQEMTEKMRAEGGKLQGTALHTTSVFEKVKSEEQAKAAAAEAPAGGGGISGRLAGRLMGGRGGASGPRSTVFTSTHEYLTVETSAAEADVTVSATFKLKK